MLTEDDREERKVLRQAGIIDSERRGTWVYYRLVPAALSAQPLCLPCPPASRPEIRPAAGNMA